MPDLAASVAAHPRRRDRTAIGDRPQVVLARSSAFPAVAHNNAARPLARSKAVPLARSDELQDVDGNQPASQITFRRRSCWILIQFAHI
jgi:hypothetical protein